MRQGTQYLLQVGRGCDDITEPTQLVTVCAQINSLEAYLHLLWTDIKWQQMPAVLAYCVLLVFVGVNRHLFLMEHVFPKCCKMAASSECFKLFLLLSTGDHFISVL